MDDYYAVVTQTDAGTRYLVIHRGGGLINSVIAECRSEADVLTVLSALNA